MRYEELFFNEAEKAKAFDKIAEQYYFGNFGRMQKSDFEILLFSLYLEQILYCSEEEMQKYSDYELSKALGVTQAKIRSLKERKELQYPYPDFDWKRSFARVVNYAQYEKGKIKINIPDKSLYLEIKNAIEINGGYVDMQLNPALLQVDPKDFFDLVELVSDEDVRKKVRTTIQQRVQEKYPDISFLSQKPIGRLLKSSGIQVGCAFIGDLLGAMVPVLGQPLSTAIKHVADLLIDKEERE